MEWALESGDAGVWESASPPRTGVPGRAQTANVFYDYQAKYESDQTQYHVPCGLDAAKEHELQGLALRAFRALAATGWGRVDLFLDDEGRPWLIEANTVPGMTSHSLVPMAAKAAGIEFDELVWQVLAQTLEVRDGSEAERTPQGQQDRRTGLVAAEAYMIVHHPQWQRARALFQDAPHKPGPFRRYTAIEPAEQTRFQEMPSQGQSVGNVIRCHRRRRLCQELRQAQQALDGRGRQPLFDLFPNRQIRLVG